MRIPCPFCGDRLHAEFAYLGDATLARPDPDAPDAPGRFAEAVHLRDNPASEHTELWYHAAGCRRWLSVTRNTRTHAIAAVSLVKETT
jgi:heterotetrameric sarcosine oxidase delta subunit